MDLTNLTDWLKRKAAIIALSVSNVEKSALNKTGDVLDINTSHHQRLNQGILADSLINGEITEEVQNLKWRTYKILKATEGVTAEIIGYDEDNMPITRVVKKDNKKGLKKVKLDDFDSYKLEMVVDNTEIVIGENEAMDNENISLLDEVMLNYDDDGEIISATHGEIKAVDYYTSHKTEKPIKIIRDELPNFELETFTKKLNVRKIDNTKRLLEFYVSKYPDEYNRTSRLFISNVKKAIDNPLQNTMLNIKGVEFVTYKTLGVSDFLEFKYKIDSFDKIIEFNGFYVIKFIATVEVDGVDITEKHRVETLDKKYEQKAKK
jgi:hypothetical protein